MGNVEICVSPRHTTKWPSITHPPGTLQKGACPDFGYTKCNDNCNVEVPVLGTLNINEYVEDSSKMCGRPRTCSTISIDPKLPASREVCLGSSQDNKNCLIQENPLGTFNCIPGDEPCQISAADCRTKFCDGHGQCSGSRDMPFKGTCKCDSHWGHPTNDPMCSKPSPTGLCGDFQTRCVLDSHGRPECTCYTSPTGAIMCSCDK